VSFFVVNTTQAFSPLPLSEDGKRISVSAEVPLSTEFTYAIKKNSTLSVEKYAFSIGEEIVLKAKIIGGKNEFLKRHKIVLQMKNAKQDEKKISGETDTNGEITFLFIAYEDSLGEVIVEAVDETYVMPIVLSQRIQLIIYRSEDGKKQGKKAIKSSIENGQVVDFGTNDCGEMQIAQGINVFEKSGTIETTDANFSFPRAGPTDKL
jgi:ribosomal protein L21